MVRPRSPTCCGFVIALWGLDLYQRPLEGLRICQVLCTLVTVFRTQAHTRGRAHARQDTVRSGVQGLQSPETHLSPASHARLCPQPPRLPAPHPTAPRLGPGAPAAQWLPTCKHLAEVLVLLPPASWLLGGAVPSQRKACLHSRAREDFQGACRGPLVQPSPPGSRDHSSEGDLEGGSRACVCRSQSVCRQPLLCLCPASSPGGCRPSRSRSRGCRSSSGTSGCTRC